MPKKDYLKLPEEIVDWRTLNLQSLDLVLCAGNSRMSKAIKKVQRWSGADEAEAVMSHVAATHKTLPDSSLYVQESTTLNAWAFKEGVQKNWMNTWVPNYDGKVYVKQLDFDRSPEFYADDLSFWNRHQDDPYESGIPGMFELLFCGLMSNRLVKKAFPNYNPAATKELHCTELVALRLLEHGLLKLIFHGKLFDITNAIDVNRLPPHFWVSKIDKFLTVPCKPLVRIK